MPEDTSAVLSPSLRIIEVDCQTDPRWENLVTTLPGGLIYHHPAWLRVLEAAFGYKPIHLACEDDTGHLRGILPLFHLHGLVTGRRLSSLPRTPVAGPLADNDQTLTLLLRAAVERVRAEPGAQLQIKMLSPALDGLVEGVVGAPWRETYRVELPSQPELLHLGSGRNQARIKWALNKASRLGVQVRSAETLRDLREWFALYLDTMRWFSVPPRPFHFFELAWEQLRPQGMMQVLLAECSEAGHRRLLAGSVLLMLGQTVFYAFNGRRRDTLTLRPNDVLQWQAIRDACAGGFRYYDLGEVTENHPSLADFKSKWGAKPQELYRYYYPAPREREIGLLESTSRVGHFAHTLWRHVPLTVTEGLSDWAHRYF